MKLVSYLISWGDYNPEITAEGAKVLCENIGKMSALRELNLNLTK